VEAPRADPFGVMAALASVPVVVRVDGAAPAVPSPAAPRSPLGSLPVTGLELLLLLLLAVVLLGVGATLVRAAR
jgi:hypothetical protein